jgi:phenylacetate-CoA ligase
VLNPMAAQMLALLRQLDDTQWLAPEALLERQLAQARELLRHAHGFSAASRSRLDAAGFRADLPLDAATWRSLPLLSRDDALAQGQALSCARFPAAHGNARGFRTPGRRAAPLTIQRTDMAQFYWDAMKLREHLWHRRDIGGQVAGIRVLEPGLQAEPPYGLRGQGWGGAADLLFLTGETALLNVTASPEAQLAWLRLIRPRYLISDPANLRRLSSALATAGSGVEGLEEIQTNGETLDASLRAELAQAFGARVTDSYLMTEFGTLASQCPDHPALYHVHAEAALVEVLHDDGRPCAPGETGRVVVTDLHNYALPLFRYDSGDRATAGPPCPCGRGLPTLAAIHSPPLRDPAQAATLPLGGSLTSATPFDPNAPWGGAGA